MANSKQAIKRARQAIKRRNHNVSQRSEMRTALKATLQALTEGKEAAIKAFAKAVIILDKLSGKNIIHPNKAARIKSRLNKKIKAID